MKRYQVVARHVEYITFEVDAEDEDDARDRYAGDGEETDSHLADVEIHSVSEMED